MRINRSNDNIGAKTDYLLLSIIIILLVALGGAVDHFRSDSIKMDSLPHSILPFIFLALFYKYKTDLKDIRLLLVVLAVLMVEQILLIFKYGPGDIIIGFFYSVIITFLIVRTIDIKTFFLYFEMAVVFMTKISLVLLVVVHLFPAIHYALIPYSLPVVGAPDFSIGIVGIITERLEDWTFIRRNTGFAWEPGRFSSILAVVLLIHLFRNRFRLFQPNFWVIVLGIISTQSTTGFMAVLVSILGYLKNSADKSKISGFWKKTIVAFGFISFFFLSPAMLEKIDKTNNSDYWLDVNNPYAYNTANFTPQRIEGLYLEFLNFLDSPIIGYGEPLEYSYVRRVLFPLANVFLSNGLFKIFAQLGVVVALLFYYCIWKSSEIIADIYNIKGKRLIFFLICMISVSYNFFDEPLILFICLYGLFLSAKDKKIYEQTKSIFVNNNSDI